MAKYTMELRELFEPLRYNPPLFSRDEVESWFRSYDLYEYLTPHQVNVIESANIWDRDRLARKIVDHYYMREIGLETPALFAHCAKVKMQELMEEYLPLIYSASIDYDPLVNVDYTESFQKTSLNKETTESLGSTETEANQTALNIHSDTPQGNINKSDILKGKYATDTDASESSGNNETTSNLNTNTEGNGSEEYTKRVKGNSGVSATAQKMIEQYRDNIRAIDREIIQKCNDLFMGLW